MIGSPAVEQTIFLYWSKSQSKAYVVFNHLCYDTSLRLITDDQTPENGFEHKNSILRTWTPLEKENTLPNPKKSWGWKIYS